MTLSHLQVGQRVRICSVRVPNPIFRRRILEMGVTPGTLVRFLGTAPLGDPLLYELRGYRLALRRKDAEGILGVPAGVAPLQ